MGGGTTGNNLNQGRRAEAMAQYIMSKFGPCQRVLQENDYGIDFYCNLMEVKGSVGKTGLLYGMQVKSGDEEFIYESTNLHKWLLQYNIPMFMCRADRGKASIKIFSTWFLNQLLVQSRSHKIHRIEFIENYGNSEKTLKSPELVDGLAKVWMGPPIVELSVNDLEEEPEKVDEIKEVLKLWVSIEVQNYSKRNIDLPIFFGYIHWDTNKTFRKHQMRYFMPHIYSDTVTDKVFEYIVQACALIGFNKGFDHKDLVPLTRHLLNLDEASIISIRAWYSNHFKKGIEPDHSEKNATS